MVLGFSYAFVSGPRRDELSLPPDSFTVRLINETRSESLRGSLAANLEGFLYVDTDLHLDPEKDVAHDDALVTVEPPGADGLRLVSINLSALSGWDPADPVRLEFGLAGVDNGATSFAIIDGIFLCGAVDEIPPTMDCPPEFVVALDPNNFDETGTPTNLQDNCDPDPGLTYVDEVNLGCPTVVTRTWTAEDAAGNKSTCVQSITDLDPESEFYT